jgi:hypothetical protein
MVFTRNSEGHTAFQMILEAPLRHAASCRRAETLVASASQNTTRPPRAHRHPASAPHRQRPPSSSRRGKSSEKSIFSFKNKEVKFSTAATEHCLVD